MNKESICLLAKQNTKKLKDKVFERILERLFEQCYTSKTNLSVPIENLFTKEELAELNIYGSNIYIDEIMSLGSYAQDNNYCLEGERIIGLKVPNLNKINYIPFIIDENLLNILGIEIKESIIDTYKFSVDEEVFLEKLEKIANGKTKIQKGKYLEIIKIIYEFLLERKEIIDRFDILSNQTIQKIQHIINNDNSIKIPFSIYDPTNQEYRNSIIDDYIASMPNTSILMFNFEEGYLPVSLGTLKKVIDSYDNLDIFIGTNYIYVDKRKSKYDSTLSRKIE